MSGIPTSLMGRAMEPAYVGAMSESGKPVFSILNSP